MEGSGRASFPGGHLQDPTGEPPEVGCRVRGFYLAAQWFRMAQPQSSQRSAGASMEASCPLLPLLPSCWEWLVVSVAGVSLSSLLLSGK